MPNGRRPYVNDDASSSLQVIDLTKNPPAPLKEIAKLPSGTTNGLAFLPDGSRLLAANDNSLLAEIDIDIETGAGVVGDVVPVGGNQAFGVAVAPDQAPIARLRVAPGRLEQPSTFDSSASTVTYGKITSYRWDFGDGSKPETTSTSMVKHTYAKAGSFIASAGGGANHPPANASERLPSTGVAAMGQDIGIAALCVAPGAGLVVLGQRRYAAHHRT